MYEGSTRAAPVLLLCLLKEDKGEEIYGEKMKRAHHIEISTHRGGGGGENSAAFR